MHTLYVGGLPREADERSLEELFASFQGVASVRLVAGNAGHRGFGYVTLSSRLEAFRAIEALNGKPIGRVRLRVDFAS